MKRLIVFLSGFVFATVAFAAAPVRAAVDTTCPHQVAASTADTGSMERQCAMESAADRACCTDGCTCGDACTCCKSGCACCGDGAACSKDGTCCKKGTCCA